MRFGSFDTMLLNGLALLSGLVLNAKPRQHKQSLQPSPWNNLASSKERDEESVTWLVRCFIKLVLLLILPLLRCFKLITDHTVRAFLPLVPVKQYWLIDSLTEDHGKEGGGDRSWGQWPGLSEVLCGWGTGAHLLWADRRYWRAVEVQSK